MGRPVYAVENFFSTRQFPDHAVTSSFTDPMLENDGHLKGHEPFRVGSGIRRGLTLDFFWMPKIEHENKDADVRVACNRTRAATYSVIDGHNLMGQTVRLQVSDDEFTTYTEVWSATIPSNVYASSLLSEGFIDESGAYIRSFDLHVGKYWRFFIDAMGAGLRPAISAVYLGLYFSPEHQVDKPFHFGESEFMQRSDPSPVVEQRRGSVHLKLAGDLEFEQARYHFDGLFFRGRPMWLIYDDEEAEKANLIKRVAGTTSIRIEDGWSEFQVNFDWQESEPEVRA